MKKHLLGTILLLITLGSLTLALRIESAKGGTITVPDDYPTIQEAINSANSGDSVFVRAGAYYENIVIDRSLTLIGEDRATVLDGNGTGLVFSCESTEVKIEGFTIQNASVGFGLFGDEYYNIDNITIANNAIEDCYIGIEADGYHGHVGKISLISNLVTRNKYGIEGASYCDSLIIMDNVFSHNEEAAINGGYQTSYLVSNNLICLSTKYGLRLFDGSNFDYNVTGNHIWNNKYGIGFNEGYYESGGAIYNNTIDDNEFGVYLLGDSSQAVFFQNNFINNTHQVYYDCVQQDFVTWNKNYPVGGNYWSDYLGADFFSGPHQNMTGSDGLGDTPYVIDTNTQDNFPLIEQAVTPKEDVFPPFIETVARTPINPQYDEEVEVNALVLDDVGVETSLLFYTYSGSTYNITMSRIGDNFVATIPALPYNTSVTYRVYAKDINQNWAASNVYTYTVTDNVSPEIRFIFCTPLLNILADISEPTNASGIQIVLFSLKINGEWWNTTLRYNATMGLWTKTIFGYNELAGTTIEYQVEVTDNAGNKNTSPLLNYHTGEWIIADLNRDGVVNIRDVSFIALNWLKHFTEQSDAGIELNSASAILNGQDIKTLSQPVWGNSPVLVWQIPEPRVCLNP